MKKDYSKRYLLVIIVLLIILIAFSGFKILSDRGNSNEKDIDLSNLPGSPKKQALISGNVVFPTAPDSPSLEGIEGAGEPAPILPACKESDYTIIISPTTCPKSKEQIKTSTINSNCEGGVNIPQTEKISCEFIIPCTLSDYSFILSPATCPAAETQTKNYNKIGQCTGGVALPSTETISCSFEAPVCTSVTYSQFSNCEENNLKIRTVLSKNPNNCEMTNEQETARKVSCIFIPACINNNYQSTLTPILCPNSGTRTKIFQKVGVCEGGIEKPTDQIISCTPEKPACTYTFSEFSQCALNSIQTRIILSKIPNDCEEGSPLLSSSCTFTPTCTINQEIQCDPVRNGILSGHKDICSSDGSRLLGENTCTITCEDGFKRDQNRCIIDAPILRELTDEIVTIEFIENRVIIKSDQLKEIISVDFKGENKSFNKFRIKRSSESDLLEYIIINDLSDEPLIKQVTLTKKQPESNSICIRDEPNLETVEEILDDCVKIACPSTSDTYGCEVNENDFLISGLSHSGIIEATISCGDTQCTGTESCSSCSIDCGTCPVQTPLRSSSGGGGGGGSRGSSNKIVTQDTQSSAQDQDTTSENNLDQNESTIETSGSVLSQKETAVTQATIPIGLYITIGIIILFAFIASIILWFFKKRGKLKKKEEPIKMTPPKKLVHNELIKAKRTYQ
jgi:hypothetical protein